MNGYLCLWSFLLAYFLSLMERTYENKKILFKSSHRSWDIQIEEFKILNFMTSSNV